MAESTDKKEGKKQDKLYQFIPVSDDSGTMIPKILILDGAPVMRKMAGGFEVEESKSVSISVNGALQYHVPANNNPDYSYVSNGMAETCRKTQGKYGKGKPGSIVEIPLTRKETRVVDGEKQEMEVSNIGNMPPELMPKTPETKQIGKLTDMVEEKDAKLAEQDAYIKSLVAKLESSKKKNKE